MKKAIAAATLIGLMLPLASGALTQDELYAQAQALLAQVQALQQQLAQAQAQQAQQTLTPPAGTGGFCPGIGRSLKRGSSGDDVTRLQQFLAQDPAVYPEGTISGYFGALTEAAVQRWQAKFNIVSSGSPETTGYGVVGPRTAAAIAIACAGGTVNGVTGVNAASPVGGFIQVTPISGNAPLTVSITATINTTHSCSAAVYTLAYGDQSNPQIIPLSAATCKEQTATFSHTYQAGGTYSVVLSSGGHQTSATVTVFGTPTPSGQTPAAQSASVGMSGSQFSPRALTVVPGTTVTWTNNDAVAHTVTADNGSFQSGTLNPGQSYSQTFTLPGTYPYYCAFHGGKGGVGMSGVVTVVSSSNPAPTTPSQTNQSALGPLGVTPNVNGNPLAAQAQFETGCSGYTINWGDNTPSLASSAAAQCTGSGTTVTLAHTYAGNGSYTISLTRGSRVDTVAIVVSQ